jgi:hypothetical protein
MDEHSTLMEMSPVLWRDILANAANLVEDLLVNAAKAEGYDVGKGGENGCDWYCNEWTNLSAIARRIVNR